MKTPLLVAISLVGLAAPQIPAQQLPALVAREYPGAVIQHMKAGKPAPCGVGEAHHNPFCFLTRDPIEKVRAFYASEGVTLGPIPIGKDQNAADDGLYDLEEAVRLQLSRENIGALYAGPVEFWNTRSSADEVSYFNAVVVMSGKGGAKLQGSPAANKAALLENETFRRFVLTPELEFMKESVELLVEPDRLVPLYNKHLTLQGAYYKAYGGGASLDSLLDKYRTKRGADMMAADNGDVFKTPANKLQAIDALLNELEKSAYTTRIMIQRSRKDGTTRDPAVLQKEWRSSFRVLKGK